MEHENYIKEYIEEKAYELWKNAGEPEGKDLEFWLQAESQVKQSFDDLLYSDDDGKITACINLMEQNKTFKNIKNKKNKKL